MFSVDSEQGKVAHVNYVADAAKSKGLDGRTWAGAVSELLGGKVSLQDSLIHSYLQKNAGRLAVRKMALKGLAYISKKSKKHLNLHRRCTTRRQGNRSNT